MLLKSLLKRTHYLACFYVCNTIISHCPVFYIKLDFDRTVQATPKITLEPSEIVVTVKGGGEQGNKANQESGQGPSQQG